MSKLAPHVLKGNENERDVARAEWGVMRGGGCEREVMRDERAGMCVTEDKWVGMSEVEGEWVGRHGVGSERAVMSGEEAERKVILYEWEGIYVAGFVICRVEYERDGM